MAQLAYVRPLRGRFLPSFMGPQASLPAAAQPAVMDIRRLRRRLLENMHLRKFRKRHAKHELKFCQHCLISRQQSLKILAFRATMSFGFDNVDNQKVLPWAENRCGTGVALC